MIIEFDKIYKDIVCENVPLTAENGEIYPVKPDIFEKIYEPVRAFDLHKTVVGARIDAYSD